MGDHDDGGDGGGGHDHHPTSTTTTRRLPLPSSPSSSRPRPLPWGDHGVNVFKSFIGSNYLSIPFCFAASGLLLGPLAMFIIAMISGWGCLLLIKVRRRLEEEKHVVDTYGQVRMFVIIVVGAGGGRVVVVVVVVVA